MRLIRMDPDGRLNYASFYIYALQNHKQCQAIFHHNSFKHLPPRLMCFLFEMEFEKKIVKVAIDFHDSRDIELHSLIWADYYFKINLHSIETLESLRSQILTQFPENEVNKEWSKVRLINPSFGIKIFSLPFTIQLILSFAFRNGLNHRLTNYMRDLLSLYIKRVPISYYTKGESLENYIFHVSSLWAQSTSYINLARARFIRCCKAAKCRFEGGFINIGYEIDNIPDLQELMYDNKKLTIKQYIKNIKQSSIVFNNPSVAYCHGWKLAEYFALGKAIISLPFSNDICLNAIDGEHYLLANNEQDEICKKVNYLLENKSIRQHLEKNARELWEKELSPSRIADFIFSTVD